MCSTLMMAGIGVYFVECIFSIACIIYFGCLFGSCENGLVCFIHYIKFVQTIYLMHTYYYNIQEKQPNHPGSTVNSFIVLLAYYICLYSHIDKIKEDTKLVHFCAVYPALDFVIITASLIFIHQVKLKSRELINNPRFTEYAEDA